MVDAVSSYDTSITGPKSILNVRTDVKPDEFMQNLIDEGYTVSSSRDGAATILDNGENRYVIRPSNSGPTTADFYPSGVRNPTLKIRLGQ